MISIHAGRKLLRQELFQGTRLALGMRFQAVVFSDIHDQAVHVVVYLRQGGPPGTAHAGRTMRYWTTCMQSRWITLLTSCLA